MRIVLPEKVNFIINRLYDAGYEAYAVGGCVRDSVLGREPMDWDITTSARPEQVKALFSYTIDTGIQHGTVTVMLDREGFEVTTYRIDGEYEDMRHPKEVIFTPLLVEDLKRRDFTFNAMAYNDACGLVDEFGGMSDLENRIVRCVGNPVDRFSEDALRMMRAVRFAAQLGCEIEENTKAAIKELSANLSAISPERVQTELVKLLISPHPDYMRMLYDYGITRVIMPEFDLMMETPQHTKHHIYNVGEHTLCSMCNIRPNKVLRLTMLLHDVGKPACRRRDENGTDHFKGHPARGVEIAAGIMKRLRFDNETIKWVSRLISVHDDRPPLTRERIRKSIAINGEWIYPTIFEVFWADKLAQSSYMREEKLRYIQQYKEIYEDIIEKKECLSIKELAVSGRDLIAWGVKPGPELGHILDRILEDVLEMPENNDANVIKERFMSGKYSDKL